MPAGGFPGMVIPARLSDGGYPTPSRNLTPDAATWHLRAALNVAALACRDDGDALVAGYNAMLASRRAALAAAEARYAAEWRASGRPDWRDGYDDAMTRTYNFYSQSFARPRFCAAAAATLADMAPVADADLPAFAAQRLTTLDQSFTDFFAAYDAWRGRATPPALIADAAPIGGAAAKPRLEVDPAIFLMP